MKEIGIVRTDTDVTFEFDIRARYKDTKLDSFPFQAQIRYTSKDGAKLLRVISVNKAVTKDRSVCEKGCNVAIVGLSAVQHAASVAQEGKLDDARLKLKVVQKMLQRVATNSDEQAEECGNFVYMSEDLDYELKQEVRTSSSSSSSSSSGSALSDATAKVVFKKKAANRTTFLSGAKKDVSARKGEAELNRQYYNIKF